MVQALRKMVVTCFGIVMVRKYQERKIQVFILLRGMKTVIWAGLNYITCGHGLIHLKAIRARYQSRFLVCSKIPAN